MYKKFIKRFFDIILSFIGLVFLSWLFLLMIVLIKIDDPGPVFFSQKRIGKNKTYFNLHKFRSMKMSTPKDVPTHLLENPENYITRMGKIMRKFSMDELPQLWDIFIGKMSIVGPRPALWNQTDLIAERDKYSANDITPGLTGLAQICGRDELEIEEKAKLDGEYANNLTFFMDLKCFFKTFSSVFKAQGVVEGGTGEINRKKEAMAGVKITMYKKFFKRFFDIILSSLILIVLSPILLIFAVAIKIDSKGPVIFKQKRLGLRGKEFDIYKFRSMCVGAEKSGVYSDDKDTRITKVGKIIRKTSIDELPQALNVLKGDMSFIGPRPPLTYHPWPIDEYTAEQKRMFEVRPGITGWAQINGRKAVEWNRRIELNVWYVDNLSFALDLKIFFATFLKVLKNSDNENIGATVVTANQEEETVTI